MPNPKIFSFDEWKTVNIRVSIFVRPSIDLSKEVSWQAIFDTVPDNQNTQPKAGIIESAGEFNGNLFVLRTLPGRSDLIFQQKVVEAGELQIQNHVNILEDFVEKANLFLTAFQNLENIEITRLAFGAELHLCKPDKHEAYRALDSLLHYVTIDETSSELQYSINRKRKSIIEPEVEINRLSQWSVQRTEVMEAVVSPTVSKPQQVHESFACRLVMDINTVPSEHVFLNKSQLVTFYAELVQFGKEIAEYGDIA